MRPQHHCGSPGPQANHKLLTDDPCVTDAWEPRKFNQKPRATSWTKHIEPSDKGVPAFYSMMFYSWCLSMIFLDKNSTHPIMRYRYLMYSKKSCEKSSFLIQCPRSFGLFHFRETRGTTGFQSSSSSTCWAVFKWSMNGSKPPRDWYHTNCCTSSPHTI